MTTKWRNSMGSIVTAARNLTILFTYHLSLITFSCAPGTPEQYIQPDDMEDLLVDFHKARAMAHNSSARSDSVDYYEALYTKAVLEKHGVSQEHFDSSFVYYYSRADRFSSIYKEVADRLDEQALILGASEGEIGKYAALNANGDTANIWKERPATMMMPVPPYNRWDFRLEADTTFRRGDAFLLQFVSDYVYQDGARNGVVYLAVDYESDTTVTRNLHFTTSGISQLRFDTSVDSDIRSVRGFFYLDGGSEQTTTTRLLFLNNVQLIRFHKQHEDNKEDSNEPAPSAQRPDTLAGSSGDTLRSADTMVLIDSGAPAHRMASRLRLPEKRQ